MSWSITEEGRRWLKERGVRTRSARPLDPALFYIGHVPVYIGEWLNVGDDWAQLTDVPINSTARARARHEAEQPPWPAAPIHSVRPGAGGVK